MANDKDDFNLINEMTRGCLYRGGESEREFWRGYYTTAVVIIPIWIGAVALEQLYKWLF